MSKILALLSCYSSTKSLNILNKIALSVLSGIINFIQNKNVVYCLGLLNKTV